MSDVAVEPEGTINGEEVAEAPKPGPRTPKPEAEADEALDDATRFERFEREQFAKKLRAEAAQHRLAKQDALGEVSAMKSKVTEMELLVNKYEAMIAQGIPTDTMGDILQLVTGTDPDAIAASVAAAKKLMGRQTQVPATDQTQGSGNAVPLNSDALEDSLRRALGI